MFGFSLKRLRLVLISEQHLANPMNQSGVAAESKGELCFTCVLKTEQGPVGPERFWKNISGEFCYGKRNALKAVCRS